MSQFYDRLDVMADQGRFLCVGLDPWPERFPESITRADDNPAEQALLFGAAIVEAVADVAAAIKPNEAFWQALKAGGDGIAAYERFVATVHEINPNLIVIGDANRTGSDDTNEACATVEFDDNNVDALTINPYTGRIAAEPLLERETKGVIPVLRTSNLGAELVQDVPVRVLDLMKTKDAQGDSIYSAEDIIRLKEIYGTTVPFYAAIGAQIRRYWNTYGNVGVEAGVSQISMQELAQLRSLMGEEIPILVSDRGEQGGTILEAAAFACNGLGERFLISESRSVAYASAGEDYTEAARDRAIDLDEQIQAGIRQAIED